MFIFAILLTLLFVFGRVCLMGKLAMTVMLHCSLFREIGIVVIEINYFILFSELYFLFGKSWSSRYINCLYWVVPGINLWSRLTLWKSCQEVGRNVHFKRIRPISLLKKNGPFSSSFGCILYAVICFLITSKAHFILQPCHISTMVLLVALIFQTSISALEALEILLKIIQRIVCNYFWWIKKLNSILDAQ